MPIDYALNFRYAGQLKKAFAKHKKRKGVLIFLLLFYYRFLRIKRPTIATAIITAIPMPTIVMV